MKIKVGRLIEINKLEDLVEPFNRNADDLEKLMRKCKRLDRRLTVLHIVVLTYILQRSYHKLKGE